MVAGQGRRDRRRIPVGSRLVRCRTVARPGPLDRWTCARKAARERRVGRHRETAHRGQIEGAGGRALRLVTRSRSGIPRRQPHAVRNSKTRSGMAQASSGERIEGDDQGRVLRGKPVGEREHGAPKARAGRRQVPAWLSAGAARHEPQPGTDWTRPRTPWPGAPRGQPCIRPREPRRRPGRRDRAGAAAAVDRGAKGAEITLPARTRPTRRGTMRDGQSGRSVAIDDARDPFGRCSRARMLSRTTVAELLRQARQTAGRPLPGRKPGWRKVRAPRRNGAG